MQAKAQIKPLIVDQAILAKNLAMLTLAAESKQTIPVLSTVLLEAKDGRLHMTATDLDVALGCSCDVVDFAPLVCAVNAKLLASIVSKATEDVRFEVDGSRLKVSYADSEMRLPVTEREHFPNIQRIEAGELELSAGIVHKLICQTDYVVDNEESRHAVVAALLRYKDGHIEAVTNDPHRLAVARAEAESTAFNLVIPKRVLNVLRAILDKQETVHIADSENLLRFDLPNMTLTGRKLAREFPNVDFVLNSLAPTKSVTVKTAAFKAAVDRVADFRDDRSHKVRIDFVPGYLELSSINVDRGQGKTRLAIDYTDEPTAVGLNVIYLAAALRVIDTDEITLQFSQTEQPVIIDANGYRAVIMSMRL